MNWQLKSALKYDKRQSIWGIAFPKDLYESDEAQFLIKGLNSKGKWFLSLGLLASFVFLVKTPYFGISYALFSLGFIGVVSFYLLMGYHGSKAVRALKSEHGFYQTPQVVRVDMRVDMRVSQAKLGSKQEETESLFYEVLKGLGQV